MSALHHVTRVPAGGALTRFAQCSVAEPKRTRPAAEAPTAAMSPGVRPAAPLRRGGVRAIVEARRSKRRRICKLRSVRPKLLNTKKKKTNKKLERSACPLRLLSRAG